MPHFGLMDEEKLTNEEAALLRARLHIRAGRRRLLEGKDTDGLATLYDALSNGLRYYTIRHALQVEIETANSELYQKELAIASQLVESGVLDSLDFVSRFCAMIDQALEGTVPQFTPRELLENLDNIMLKLGVMPFAEDELPPEPPGTF